MVQLYSGSLTHFSVAYISASALLRAVTLCLFAIHVRGPLWYTIKLDMDLTVSCGTDLGVAGSGTDWSWGPQFASVSGKSLLCWMGKFRYASSFVFLVLEKHMPPILAPC